MKKRISLHLWNHVQPLLEQYRKYVIVEPPNTENAFIIGDADPNSNFFFIISHQNTSGGMVKYKFEPESEISVKTYTIESTVEEMAIRLKQWFELLKAYDELVTIYDDPIQKAYEAEFTDFFRMADEKADKIPFDLPRQLLFGDYLAQVAARLAIRQANESNVEKAAELAQLINETESLKADLPALTQNQTISRMAKLWAKARKHGIDLIKDLFSEFKKESLKKLTGEIFKEENWHSIKDLLD